MGRQTVFQIKQWGDKASIQFVPHGADSVSRWGQLTGVSVSLCPMAHNRVWRHFQVKLEGLTCPIWGWHLEFFFDKFFELKNFRPKPRILTWKSPNFGCGRWKMGGQSFSWRSNPSKFSKISRQRVSRRGRQGYFFWVLRCHVSTSDYIGWREVLFFEDITLIFFWNFFFIRWLSIFSEFRFWQYLVCTITFFLS